MKKKIKKFHIAVDGISASGKTTASKIISKKFKLKLLSSGKLYRYIAYKIIKNNNSFDKSFVRKISRSISEKDLNSKKLYSQNITNLSSIIAKKKYIRNYLKKYQMDFIKKNKFVIIEGRDIASKILPNADLKLFFKCSIQKKALRRFKEFKKNNSTIKINEVEKALKLRDFSDKNRKESPLLFIKGAVLVDTTNLTLKQMEDKIIKLVRMKIKQKIDANI
jgi:cytidylate kinase|tara:strand:- start:2940 stop:3602 length:663 start_codon:yes stop_codon:yes gene_type:complete